MTAVASAAPEHRTTAIRVMTPTAIGQHCSVTLHNTSPISTETRTCVRRGMGEESGAAWSVDAA